MKKNYNRALQKNSGNKTLRSALLVLAVFLFLITGLKAQQVTYTFTTAGATNSLGPIQAQINSAYAATTLSNAVVSNGGIQTWTVPASGLYRIDGWGAAGGNSQNGTKTGGAGARMIGEFNLVAGGTVQVLVGQFGESSCGNAGGGGGSYVVYNGTLLLAAGGGGGASSDMNGVNGVTVTAGAQDGGLLFNGGTNGQGGQACVAATYGGGGGGGYISGNSGNGVDATQGGGGGRSFLNGGVGGLSWGAGCPAGGFGGGGGGRTCTVGGGGGGGYSGGAGGQHINTCFTAPRGGGGGGGSFNSSVTQTNTAGYALGDGKVTITSLCNINLVSTLNPICAGNSITLTTNAVSGYSWSTGSTASSLVVSPSVTTVYSVVGTSSANCVASSVLTVVVSAGLPVLSVTTSTNITCLGKTVTLTANGALTYTWTGGATNGISFTPSVTSQYTVTGQNGCGTSTAVTGVTLVPLPITAATSPTIICASTAATMTAVGPATVFNWQPFTGVLSGSMVIVNPSVTTLYTVTASDGTCAGTATVLLTAKPNPTVSIAASSSMVCEGYPVTFTASGGQTYNWQPGNQTGTIVTVNPTAPSLYTVVATNSLGCTALTTAIVLTSPSPTVTIAANNTLICAGAAVNIVAGGADTYLWNTGPITSSITVNPQVTTTYTVTGTSNGNGCSAQQAVTINAFNPPVTVVGTQSICTGGNATLTASGADAYTWDNGSNAALIVVSPSVTTTYTLTSTSSTINNLTCNQVKTISVLVLANPPVTAAANTTLICKGESAKLTASGAANYLWNNGQTTTSINVTPTLAIVYTFTVSGSDANGCSSTASVQVKVSPCNGIASGAANGGISVYPNPSKGEFIIEGAGATLLSIINEIGQIVKTMQLNESNNFKVQISDLAAGIYFIKGQHARSEVNLKIVVSK